MRELYEVRPIGVVHSAFSTRDEVVRSDVDKSAVEIEVFENYEDGLQDIDGFSHLIVLFWMDRSSFESLLVRPLYCPETLRGVFATRHPDRPNPIGLTVVELLERDKNVLKVKGADMLDGTPVLDVKPYTRHDCKDGGRFGWLREAGGLPWSNDKSETAEPDGTA